MPVLTKLKSWKYGFNSPFKAEVYFVNTKQYTDQKWGASNPIMMRDQEFGILRLRAFGIFSFKVDDSAVFLKETFGSNGNYGVYDIVGQLKRSIVSGLTDIIAEAIRDAAQNTGGGLAATGAGIGAGAVIGQAMMGAFNNNQNQAVITNASVPTVKCPSCKVDVKAGSKFCSSCGQSMEIDKKKCVKCGFELANGVKFCPECGTKQELACSQCNEILSADTKFCPKCGNKVK